jgi:hypothetical protein
MTAASFAALAAHAWLGLTGVSVPKKSNTTAVASSVREVTASY